LVISPDSIAWSIVGIILDGSSVGITEFIPIGCTHIKNNPVKMNPASKKFIITHAKRTEVFWKIFFS